MKSVAVVILHFYGGEMAIRAIESLRRSRDVDMQIVIVDNGSRPEERSRLAAMAGGGITLLTPGSNLGYTGGANLGIESLRSVPPEFVFIANQDTIVPDDAVAMLAAAAD